MADCPYLIYKESKGCVNCLGWRCTAGREKKLSDVSVCRDEEEWRECMKYLSLQPKADEIATSTPTDLGWAPSGDVLTSTVLLIPDTPQICPYLEPTIGNECCNATCHAKGVRVAPRKNCRSWETCTRYLIAKLEEKPFRGGG